MDWYIIAVALISVAAISAIIYGVRSNRDNCELKNFPAFDQDRIPIMITVDHLVSVHVRRAIDGAIVFWNTGLGYRAFTREVIEEGSVVPVMGFEGDESARRKRVALAYVRITVNEDNVLVSASIRLNTHKIDADGIDFTKLRNAMAHEMGHLLGLAHDGHPPSVMYPKALSNKPVITGLDKRWLKTSYGMEGNG